MENIKHFFWGGDEPLQPSADITKHRLLGGLRVTGPFAVALAVN